MSNIFGLSTDLIFFNGLLLPFLPPPGVGLNTVFDMDFRVPVTVGIEGNGTFSSTFATDEWLLQETSGTYASNTGGTALTNNAGNGLQGQTAVGLWDGSSYIARNAWEVRPTAASGTDYLHTSGDATALDSDDEDLCAVIVFRSIGPSATNHIFTKRGAAGESLAGWNIRWGGGGAIVFNLDPGAESVFNDTLVGNHKDGAWHYAKFFYDKSTELISVKTDLLEALNQASGFTGSMTNSAEVTIGRWIGGDSNPSPGLQVAYAGGCVGANAASMFAEEIILPGADPSGLLTTQSRGSLISVAVTASHVHHFPDDALPIGFHSAFTSGLGLYVNSAIQNIDDDSNDLSTWTNSNSTDAQNAADGPDGMVSANSLTATAANGSISKTVGGTASTQYTYSVWIERNGGSDVEGEIRLQDTVNVTETVQAFTATAIPQRFDVTHTNGVGGSLDQYIQIDTDTESILVYESQSELGAQATANVKTTGSVASLVASQYRGDDILPAALARMEITSIIIRDGASNRMICDSGEAANRRALFVNSANNLRALVSFNSTTVINQLTIETTQTLDTELVTVARWSETAGAFPEDGTFTATWADSDSTVSGTASDTSADALLDITVGNSSDFGNPLNGFVQRIQVFDGVGEGL